MPVIHSHQTEAFPPEAGQAQLAERIAGEVRAAVLSEVAPLFEDLRRFTDRRIAELSAEVHGAVQMVDFSESNLSSQLGGIQEQITRLISVPSMSTRNSGLELEAVVQATETAANRIMEAAETIGDWVREGKTDPEAFFVKIDAIFEACSFQDMTGQRIRRAIEHLEHVESVLAHMVDPDSPIRPGPPEMVKSTGSDLNQVDIDSLMADF
jgi:chemotaxis protein CheZ